MKPALILAQVLSAISICWAQSPKPQARLEAEYYVVAYAQHYRVPVALVRAIVERESHWQACAVSPKGAAGLMQKNSGSLRDCSWPMPAAKSSVILTSTINSTNCLRAGRSRQRPAEVFVFPHLL